MNQLKLNLQGKSAEDTVIVFEAIAALNSVTGLK